MTAAVAEVEININGTLSFRISFIFVPNWNQLHHWSR
jgi:hypothetical protein